MKKKKKTWLSAWMEAVGLAKGEMKLIVLLFGWFPALLAHDPDKGKKD